MPYYQDFAAGVVAGPTGNAQTGVVDLVQANAPGARLMDLFRRNGWSWPSHAILILDEFHKAMQDYWTWVPSSVGGGGAALLDGQPRSGACGQLAHAFATLLKAPDPHGFGVRADECRTFEWSPERAFIFISQHRGALFRLRPNILKCDWQKQADPYHNLYSWGNHVVVKCGDRYYDPCYNMMYAEPADMAMYTGVFRQSQAGPLAEVVATDTMNRQSVFLNIGRPDTRPEVQLAGGLHPLASLIAPEGFA